ncbi:MAG: hypothetical protein FVQ80_17265 [Planctomycetes bacterium]|nr:hypothetical protein [Planctomycetota bacterium]
METIQDFEDMLFLLNKHDVKYLVIGGLAFIYHAKPRYTKDMDLWIKPDRRNIIKANRALEEFSSPVLIMPDDADQIIQIGVAPDRIDILLNIPGVQFDTAWRKKIVDNYGVVETNWIDIDSLIRAKQKIDNPRHQEDVRVLLEVKRLKKKI